MASQVIERDLYNGKYHMVHNPNAKGRAPRYVVNDEMKPKGVTTILGQTLSKDLMDWAVGMAVEYLRKKIPVVTDEDLEEASNAYKYRRDAGASTGTEAHALVEDFLKGKDVEPSNSTKEAQNAYRAFVKWFNGLKDVEVLNVEEVIYSENLEYAGTYDCMLKIDGKVYLCDLKTTNSSRKAPNGVYAENFIQLGAYAFAHNEQRAYEEENEGTKLVEIDDLMVISGKKTGIMDVVTASDVGLTVKGCGELFSRVVNIYHFMLNTTKKLGG